MENTDSPASSLNSAGTGDTGQLLQELMNLQKSNAMSSASISSTLNMRESADVPLQETAPTINELMQTFYSHSQHPNRQLITLQGSDTVNSFSVYGQEVDIVASKPLGTSSLSQSTGSNKVKITPVVKYDWEPIFYIGNLVAIHRNNAYAAYTLRGKSGGVVRIINRKTAERALLKDFAGRVIDIAFAHTDDILIGAVDEIGNLMVYHIKETDDRKLIVSDACISGIEEMTEKRIRKADRNTSSSFVNPFDESIAGKDIIEEDDEEPDEEESDFCFDQGASVCQIQTEDEVDNFMSDHPCLVFYSQLLTLANTSVPKACSTFGCSSEIEVTKEIVGSAVYMKWAGQDKVSKELLGWVKDIINHYRYTAQTTNTKEEFVGMWIGVLHHVINVHEWILPFSDSSRCQHGPLESTREKGWLEKDSPPHKALRRIALDKRLLNNISYYLNCRSTAELENFQNLILMHASKRHSYRPPTYRCRNLLAAIDNNVHSSRSLLTNKDGSISVLLCMHVRRPEGESLSEYHRVIWCPFIPDDCDDSSITESSTQDASRVLVLTHDEKAEIWNLDLVAKEHGNGPVDVGDVDFGLIQIQSHTQPIMDAAFSPDGTALATASLDGEVKFFQVNMNESTSPRCLHQWKPHDGKKLSSLFFLDDHKNSSPDAQFWKFAVTGAEHNQELKIWSCESWTCLQTLNFVCPPGLPSNFQIDPCMKSALDLSAKYLILTDIKRKVLYILQVFQDNKNDTAHFCSISEFMLAQPCLSFAILDASKKKFKKAGEDTNIDDMTTGELVKDDEDTEQKLDITTSGVQIRLYTVHPKALQELQIRFKPESSAPPTPTPSISTVSHDDTGIQDALSDLSMDTNAHNNSHDVSQPLLLTPDAFTSSPRKAQIDTTTEPTRTSMGSSTSSFTHVTGLQEELYSPRSSQGNQSVISEGSTITQTPNSKEFLSNVTNGETTPGSVPLPPVTSTEEQDLETPKSKGQGHSGETTPISLERLNNVCMDDFFDTQGSRQTIDRTMDTTSTTGFEVVEGSQKAPDIKESFDENDEEVAEVLGETFDDEEERKVQEGTQPFVEQTLGKTSSDLGSTQGSGQVIRAWPQPPDVGSDAADEEENEDNEPSEYQDEGDEDVQVEEEEEVVEEETSGDKEPVQEASSEEIEEQILEEQSEESEQEGPRQAPVAEFQQKVMIKEVPVRIREVKEIIRETVDKQALSQLQDNVQNILSALESQNSVIERLQEQLSEQQEKQFELQRQQFETDQLRHMSQQTQPNIEEHLGKIEGLVTSRVERMFTQHAQKEHQRINQIMQQSENREKQRHDRLQQILVQTLQTSIASNVEAQVKGEMRTSVLPAVTRSMEPIKDQLHQELAQKLTATDSLLKDSIGKMVRSRQTTEAIGLAAGNALQTPIQAAYREAFQNIVIPNFDRATQNMFQQVNEAFTKGTKDYIRTLESHLDQIKQKHTETRDPIIAQMRKLVDSFQTSAETMKAQVTAGIKSQVQNEMQNAFLSLQETLLRSVRQAVKDEVSNAVQEQGATISSNVLDAMRSGAVTPAPVSPDPQHAKTHIMQLLRQGQLNAAFQQALSAANLEMVVYVCETVNPAQIFNQSPCPLEQPVLLSLIQQLSADIGNNTELKHKYLEEAVMNLDLTNKITQEHMRGVLYSLIQKLKVYIGQHPNDKTCRSLRMLQMASESLLK